MNRTLGRLYFGLKDKTVSRNLAQNAAYQDV